MSFDLFTLPAPKIIAPQFPQAGGGFSLSWCQREDVDTATEAFRKSYRKVAVVGATGYGKGPMIAEMAGRMLAAFGPGLVLVDRANLVEQLADEIDYHLDTTVGRVADGSATGLQHSVVVSTVQAMYTRDRTDRPLYEYPQITDRRWVIVDEAHKFFASCFRAVCEHFVDMNGARVALFTATPVAANGDDWRSFADWTAHEPGPCNRTISWCVENGLLVPMRQGYVHARADVSKVYEKLSAVTTDDDQEDSGDELAGVLIEMLTNTDERAACEFASGVAQAIGDARAMIFSPPRVEALKLLTSWLKHSVPCEAVWGARPNKSDILKAFKRGYPQALASVNMLCEGANFPEVSKGFVFRTIKNNWRMSTQIAGRMVRLHPSIQSEIRRWDGPEYAEKRRQIIADSPKPEAFIYDLVGNDGRAQQSTVIEVLAGDQSEDIKRAMGELIQSRIAKSRKSGEPIDKDLLAEAATKVLTRQNDELAELARRRGMAGEFGADVTVSYDTPLVALPIAPTAKHAATVAEKAMYVAFAVDYDVAAAVAIANTKPRNQLRGMTQGARAKLAKMNRKPDWRRAQRAFPEWIPNWKK